MRREHRFVFQAPPHFSDVSETEMDVANIDQLRASARDGIAGSSDDLKTHFKLLLSLGMFEPESAIRECLAIGDHAARHRVLTWIMVLASIGFQECTQSADEAVE